MAAAKKLAKFTITEAGEGFNLHIEDEAGPRTGTHRNP